MMDARTRSIRRSYAQRKRDVAKAPVVTPAFTVIVDTREQRPYKFAGSVRAALKTGDYSVRGYEDRIALERKGFDDLFACLGMSLRRFRQQLSRLRDMEYSAVIIDTTPDAIILGHFKAMIKGHVALDRILALSVEYNVPVFFAGRKGAEVAASWLAESWKDAQKLKPKKKKTKPVKKATHGSKAESPKAKRSARQSQGCRQGEGCF